VGQADIVLRVRFRSELSFDEIMEIVERRAPEFEALAGLKQKYYLQDPESGEIAGLYFWESLRDLEDYKKSELRASIVEAYRATSEPDIEVYRVVKVLRSGDV